MKAITLIAPAKMLSIKKKKHRTRRWKTEESASKEILPYESLHKPLAKDR
jgi:hypothetical protein